ncbi:hypothetical protein E3P89_02149 [Wallemia ichthyophaga]|uniref:BZIP domain-containing protein n=1 Tax=Wallemia ichthyophaga TaxID=245174 RepID=A0A4T0HIU7_WALIC|nr:hypothetical protein E3P90_01472 [Wallemia ichthyophaga]TIB15906.1 hypothetical protein E3P93_01223 [Wallemia ichthyophaga]TIB22441.1 hypothetical protein E3P89_02149 [Wallemia ichthyophaga]TIB25809.1 hypothetical protein E3P88_01427 [Wallemia ichthyophaga]
MSTIKAAPQKEITGKIYVQPTKNWEIPARPKPGRKPIEADPVNRKSQNRVAQRAFRERKQEYVQELEQRLQEFESNSIQRHIALQQVSQKLKQENDTLKEENVHLKRRLEMGTQTRRAMKRKFSTTAADTAYAANTHAQQTKHTTPPPPPIKLHVDDDLDKFFSCGFCSEETPCVCRQISEAATDKADNAAVETTETITPPTKILDNPPSIAPAQPLRKKRTQSKKLFTVQTECSGDPENCMACQVDDSLACRDDKPGRAFFEALQGSVCQDGGGARCEGCPGHNKEYSQGEGKKKKDLHEEAEESTPEERAQERVNNTHTPSIPASDAWRRLKSHPNIGLADLALLADLVGSRTRCTGAELHQQVEKVLENVHRDAEVRVDMGSSNNELDTSNHASARRNSTSLQLPQLVPHDQLISNSKRRKLLVEMGAVRDALDVLDRFSAPPAPQLG